MAERKKKGAESSKAGRSRVDQAREALAQAQAALAQATEAVRGVTVALTVTERSESAGKLRVGEASVLGVVLDAAEKYPALVEGHAADDGGVDPTRFETELLREWLELHGVFAEAATEVEKSADALVTLLADTAKFHGARVRRPTLRVYGDLATLSRTNNAIHQDLTEALAYYGQIGRKAARTRAKRKP